MLRFSRLFGDYYGSLGQIVNDRLGLYYQQSEIFFTAGRSMRDRIEPLIGDLCYQLGLGFRSGRAQI